MSSIAWLSMKQSAMRCPTAWNVPIWRSNCLRSIVYCAVMRIAWSATPDTTAHEATVTRLSVHVEDLAALLRCTEPRVVADAHTVERISNSGSWFIVCWRAQRDARRVGGNEEHDDVVAGGRGYEHRFRDVRGRHVRLHTVDAPAVAVARRRGRGLVGFRAELDERGREQHVAGHDLRQHRLLRFGPEAGDRQAGGDERRDRGQRRDGATDLAQHEAQIEEAEAEPAGRLRERDAEQVRLGELGPRVPVVPLLGEVARLQVREAHPVLEDLSGQALQLFLRFGECEVHSCLQLA